MNESNYYTSQGQVICQECKKGFQVIGGAHLKKHTMSMEQYKEKYPNAPLSAKSFGARQKYKHLDLKGFGNANKEEFGNDIKNVPASKEIRTKAKILETKSQTKKPEKELPPILQNKIDIIKFLKTMHSGITPNYFIEKTNLSGLLEYSYITDIVDLSTKTDFEFQNAFWHNRDARQDRLRDDKLKNDGWTIIRIDEQYPKIDDVMRKMDLVSDT